MSRDDTPHVCSPSTTTLWKTVKIALPPEADRERRSKSALLRLMTPGERRKPLNLVIVRRGGGEMWYEIRARGRVLRFPGYLALHDVMNIIYGERW